MPNSRVLRRSLRKTSAGARKHWAVLISGRGSNLAALLECRDEIDLRLVVSSEAGACGLVRARRAGVPTCVTPYRPDDNRTSGGAVPGAPRPRPKIDWVALDEQLRARGITHLFLAGFMRIVPTSFIAKWNSRILNLHPSLLPAYPGLRSIERAFTDGSDLGVTVHEVTPQVDAGTIVRQRRSLNAGQVRAYAQSSSFQFAEFLVHVDEQRVVKEAIRRWDNWPMW